MNGRKETKVVLNDKEITLKPFTYNMICDLEDFGISIASIFAKTNKTVRAYIALSADISLEEAGLEIETFIMNGGEIDTIATPVVQNIVDSDFFQSRVAKTNKKEKK